MKDNQESDSKLMGVLAIRWSRH